MPTYIYFDPETGEEQEVQHSMDEDPEIINESTGNKMKRKITGGMGVIYRGKGWTGGGKDKAVSRDDNYHIDRHKEEMRAGTKVDPYAKFRDEPL